MDSRDRLEHFVEEYDSRHGLVFRYLDIQDATSDGHLYNPIYVTLQTNAVDFFYHGKDPDPSSDQQAHIHYRVMHLLLPVERTIDHELCTRLRNCATESWLPQEWIKGTHLQILPAYGYSGLHCWSVLNDYFSKRNEKAVCFDGRTAMRYTGRILLDFLFDLTHEIVFSKSESYNTVKSRLFTSNVGKALCSKAEYYWRREELEHLLNSDSRQNKHVRDDGRGSDHDQPRMNYSRMETEVHLYNNARLAWLRVCMSQQEGTDLNKAVQAGGWFMPVEDEVQKVVFGTGQELTEKSELINQDQTNKTASQKDEQHTETPEENVREREIHSIAAWFLRRYHINAAVAIMMRTRRSDSRQPRFAKLRFHVLLVLLFYLALIVYTGIGWRHLAEAFEKEPDNLAFHFFLYGIILFVVCLAQYIFGHSRKSESRESSPHPVTNILLVSGSLLWLTCMLADIGAFDLPRAAGRRFSILITAALVGVLVTIFLVRKTWSLMRRMIGRRIILLWIRLFLPRMVVAISGAWLLIVTSEELAIAGLLVDWADILKLGVPLLAITWLFAVIEVDSKIHNLYEAMRRGVIVLALGFFISTIIGLVATHLLLKPTIVNSGYIQGGTFLAQAAEFSNERECLLDPNEFSNDVGEGMYTLRACANSQRNMPPLLKRAAASPHLRCRWSESEIRFAQLECLSWGIEGTPLSHTGDSNGIRVLCSVYAGPFGTWLIYPGLLLYGSCIAVFIGLFLQLIFEEKPMTEPL